MPIQTTCSSCSVKINVKDELIGKAIKCPKCGEHIAVPESGSLAITPVSERAAQLSDPLATAELGPSATPGLDRTADLPPAASAPAEGGTATFLQGQDTEPNDTASGRASAMASVPGYEIECVLGRGGMGVVYKARHLTLKRTVALKMVLAGGHAGPADLARFRIEAEAVARLQHPNIVQIHEVGETGGRPYCSLEFVDGGNLAGKLDGKPLPAQQAAKLVETLARAMQLAHSRNVVHRDLKPANILLTSDEEGGWGTPKITDFGLARQLDSDSGATQAGAVMGTPSYMAPEQASGQAHEAGPAADVYALGAILYECLAGQPPFKGKSIFDTLDQVRTQEPLPPSRWQKSAPLDLETICLKCLRKEPEKRYASAGELADELVRYQQGVPILARPVGHIERLRRWCARKPALASMAFGLVAVVVAAFSVVVWQLNETTAALAREEVAREAEAARTEGERLAKLQAKRQQQIALDEAAEKEEARALAETQKGIAVEAAAAEKDANARAQKRLKEIEKANDILGAIFENLDPQVIAMTNRPLQAILVDTLDNAVAQLEGESIGDPLVVAAMQQKFGKSLLSLGEPGKAIVLLEKARATRQTMLGPNNPFTLATMVNLASAYQDAGKLDRALPLFEETLPLLKALKHPGTHTCMNNLAGAYIEARKPSLAVPLLTETAKLRTAMFGPEDPATLTAMTNLGNAYLESGKLDRALPLLEETFKVSKTRLGPAHPITLTCMSILGTAYQEAGKQDLGLALLEEALNLQTKTLGAEHPVTIGSKNNLAVAYKVAGKLDQAVPLMEETLKLAQVKLGTEHHHTLTAMNHLAGAYGDSGKWHQAISLYEERLKFQRVKPGPDHPDTLTTMHHLAEVYRRVGKLDLAQPLYEQTLKLQKSRFGPEHPDTLQTLNGLAYVYSATGKRDLALATLEETLKLQKDRLGPDHPDTLTTMNNLAAVYRDAGKRDQSLMLLEETFKLRKARIGPDHPNTLITMSNLAVVYQQAGKLELAVPLFEEALKLQKARVGPEHPDTVITLNGLGVAYWRTGKRDQALPLLEESYKLTKAQLGPEHPQTLTFMKILLSVYQQTNKLALALPLLEENLRLNKAKLGPDDPETLFAMNNLAMAYWRDKQLDKSIPLFEETLKRVEAKFGRNHPNALLTVANLGVNYRDAGRLAQALPLLEEAYRAAKKDPNLRFVVPHLLDAYAKAGESVKFANLLREQVAEAGKALPADRAKLAGMFALVGLGLLEQKKGAEAELLLRECLAIREKTEPTVWTTFNTKSLLGGAFLAQKKYADAEPLLLAGYEGMKKLDADIPPQGKIRISEAIERLVQLYEAMDNPDEAAKWRKTLESIKTAKQKAEKQ